MAVAAIAGTSGTFSLAGHIVRCARWSANLTQEVNDCSGFGQTLNWRENLAGMKSMTGEFSGFLTASAASTAPAADFTATGDATVGVAFTLTAKTGNTYSGTCFVSNMTPSTGIDGNATISGRFVATGTVVEAWATT